MVQSNTDSNSDAPLPDSNRTRLDVFIVTIKTNHTIEDFSIISIKQKNIDNRLKHPTSGFYTIDKPPPNLS